MDNTIINIIDVEVEKRTVFGAMVLEATFKVANQRGGQIEEGEEYMLTCSDSSNEARCTGFAMARNPDSVDLENPLQSCVYEFKSSGTPEALRSEKGFPFSVLDGKLEKLNSASPAGTDE